MSINQKILNRLLEFKPMISGTPESKETIDRVCVRLINLLMLDNHEGDDMVYYTERIIRLMDTEMKAWDARYGKDDMRTAFMASAIAIISDTLAKHFKP